MNKYLHTVLLEIQNDSSNYLLQQTAISTSHAIHT